MAEKMKQNETKRRTNRCFNRSKLYITFAGDDDINRYIIQLFFLNFSCPFSYAGRLTCMCLCVCVCYLDQSLIST